MKKDGSIDGTSDLEDDEEDWERRRHHYDCDEDDSIKTAFGQVVGQICFYTDLYPGYDYYDVGGAQIDGLIGGVRFWY